MPKWDWGWGRKGEDVKIFFKNCLGFRRVGYSAGGTVGVVVAWVVPATWEEGEEGLSMSLGEGDTLISVGYETGGKAHGVFFRKYTQAEGQKLEFGGWIQNTDQGTVWGQFQGCISKVRHMQGWLEKEGIPKQTRIDRANFYNEKGIS